MTLVYGEKLLYGMKIGILMMDYLFARPSGDIGNAKSFNYPVLYEVVENFNLESTNDDEEKRTVECLIEAAKKLERRGVKIIFASCGLLLPYQELLSESLNIPVCLSPLIMLPMIQQIIGLNKKVVVLMSRENKNIEKNLAELVGIDKNNYIIAVMNNCPEFIQGIDNPQEPYKYDTNLVEAEILNVCDDVLSQHQDVGAFLLECTNMGPYSNALRNHTHLPVFDIVVLINMMESVLPDV